jgi:Flp pilus assembly protein TadG
MKMKKFLREETGNAIVFTTIAMVVLFGFMSLGIDVGSMMIARNQLQATADGAALAGASGLLFSQGDAITRAIQIGADNTCMNQAVQISPTDVTFPTSSRVRVQANQTINLNFARVIGIPTANISAVAEAEVGTINGTNGLKPWAVPDLNWTVGQQATIKSGTLGAPATNPGYFYPVDFPPINRGTPISGAQDYESNIMNGSISDIYINDVLQVEPGNMVGPTQQGVDYLISLDPNAHWENSGVVDSAYPGFSRPRIIKLPLYDPNIVPDSGRNTVTVIGLAAFFLEGVQGRDVTGRFLAMITGGSQGNNGNSMLKGVKLVL